MKNLVMGVAKGYGWDILEPFVTSFAKNCRSAELVLFVDDISDFTRDRLIQAGVLLKTFPDEMKRGIPNNTRWKIFSDFLETHGDAYEQIFITDTRDVRRLEKLSWLDDGGGRHWREHDRRQN